MIDSARLEAIVREAGQIAHGMWPGAGHSLDAWEKSPGNPVCAADIEVDAFLKRELGALLPAAGWLSEETADDPARLGKGLIWLVDPVDGTRDFIRGRTGWAVSVALISEARPLMGFLAAPARDEFWSGISGRGSWRNGERLLASERKHFSGARVPADSLPKEDRDLATVDKPNSIALRAAMVAADEADLLATLRWGWEWDIGAAALIAREAGAAVTDAFGRPLNYNKRDPRAFGLLVSAPAIHDAAVERLAGRAKAIAGDRRAQPACGPGPMPSRLGDRARLKLKAQLMVGDEIAFGPGKADLLDAIAAHGSISAAARSMGLSYRRAWLMVDAMNRLFRQPLVATTAGARGGSKITREGARVLTMYRKLQASIEAGGHETGQELLRSLV